MTEENTVNISTQKRALIGELHSRGLTLDAIAAKTGLSKGAVASQVRLLTGADLKPPHPPHDQDADQGVTVAKPRRKSAREGGGGIVTRYGWSQDDLAAFVASWQRDPSPEAIAQAENVPVTEVLAIVKWLPFKGVKLKRMTAPGQQFDFKSLATVAAKA